MPTAISPLHIALPHFDLARTLDCGQAFRWEQLPAGAFHGVAFGRALTVRQEGSDLFFSCSEADFTQIWRPYFDLGRDYDALLETFRADAVMREAIAASPGIRILRQEPWEALCSFILSQNNHIPRIKGIVRRLCEGFGDALGGGDFSFPPPERLAGLTVADLAPLRAGFRAGYLLDAAQKVASGEVGLAALSTLELDQARAVLQRIRGVGPKVAECTLLYGCGRMEAFPADVWMKRVLAECYPGGLPACILGNQGIAQQYLFDWRRTQKARSPESFQKDALQNEFAIAKHTKN